MGGVRFVELADNLCFNLIFQAITKNATIKIVSTQKVNPYLSALRRPTTSDEILLEVMLSSHESFKTTIGGSEGPHIPHPHCVIHGV